MFAARTLEARWGIFTQGRTRKLTLFTTWCRLRFLVSWSQPMKLSLETTFQAADPHPRQATTWPSR
nr:hypothetical protein [Desulfovermiculus halophilus]